MLLPTKEDYIQVITSLVERFEKENPPQKKRGRPFNYSQKMILVFFILMHLKRIFSFKAQCLWLQTHQEEAKRLGFFTLPHRTTLSRRYKKLSCFLETLIDYIGHWAEGLGEEFSSKSQFQDKSLFKAKGPVWHQKDKRALRIPKGLRNLDLDASWSKSGYHGWVFGYGLHLTVNSFGFPKSAAVETGSVSEAKVFEEKIPSLLSLSPQEFVADDAYTDLKKVSFLAKEGVALITPALRLGNGSKSQAYKGFISKPENAFLLRLRKRVIEPVFDLTSKVAGIGQNQKQLPVKGIMKVRTFLLLSVFLIQVVMIVNSLWRLPFREISRLMVVMI